MGEKEDAESLVKETRDAMATHCFSCNQRYVVDERIKALEISHAAKDAEIKRLREAGKDVTDAWRSGESASDYEELLQKAVNLFGCRE